MLCVHLAQVLGFAALPLLMYFTALNQVQKYTVTLLCISSLMNGADCPVETSLETAGAGPVGRLGPAAQQARPPFQDAEVAAGQYELSALMTHQPPSLQACPGHCHVNIIANKVMLMAAELLHCIWVLRGKVHFCPSMSELPGEIRQEAIAWAPMRALLPLWCLLACSAVACMGAGAGMQNSHGWRADCGDCIRACEPRLPSAAGHSQRHICRWWRAALAEP